MQRDDEVYVGRMLDLSRKVASKTAGVRREDFDRNENLRLALAHLLQTIGEAARRVSREYQTAHPEIPWGVLAGCATRSCMRQGAAQPVAHRSATITPARKNSSACTGGSGAALADWIPFAP